MECARHCLMFHRNDAAHERTKLGLELIREEGERCDGIKATTREGLRADGHRRGEKKSKMRSGDGDAQRAGWRWPWGSGEERTEERAD